MENKKKLAFAIAKYLKDEMKSNSQEDESLEVAIQCLENAFDISVEDSTLDVGVSLSDVFDAILKKVEEEKIPASDEAKAEAEQWKTKGNDCLRAEMYQEALECYNKAIALDASNPVYYCNRAAAHSHLNNHQMSVNDCKAAIRIDPNYSKAYVRLGSAYNSLNKLEDAKKSFLKALEIDPSNTAAQTNLERFEETRRNASSLGGAANGGSVPFGDFSSMLGNQQLMSMASQMLSDPSMQSMLNNVMAGGATPGGGGMDGLLQAGQRLAQMLQSTNPDLVDQLRQQVTRGGYNPPNNPPN